MPTKRKSRLGVKLFVLKLCKQTYFMYLVCTRLILSFFAISFLLARILVLKNDDSSYAKRMSEQMAYVLYNPHWHTEKLSEISEQIIDKK